MFCTSLRFSHITFLLAMTAVVGCEGLTDDGSLVNVFATHHASPENGKFPDRGAAGQPRTFDLPGGRELLLSDPYVTISALTLVSCGGREHSLKMFWGPCPEDLRTGDLELLTVAGGRVDSGDYCELKIDYSAYEMPTIDEQLKTRHVVPSNDSVDGATIYLRGVARTGDPSEDVLFELRNRESFTVTLDLLGPKGPGRPLSVRDDEAFPEQLTISKTYDRFFDGIDWENFDAVAAENELDEILTDQTQVVIGQNISPDNWPER